MQNHGKVLEQKKRYREKNRELLAKKQRDYYQANKNKILPRQREYGKVYYQINREKELLRRVMWRKENREHIKIYSIIYRILNRDKINKRLRDREKTDIKFYISNRLRHRVREAFKAYSENGKIKPADEYGINYQEIVNKLLKEIPKDFNEIEYNIEHIIPLFTFDLNNESEIKKAFSPDNHQWLTVEAHRNKTNAELSSAFRG
jgi:hypothetical protein